MANVRLLWPKNKAFYIEKYNSLKSIKGKTTLVYYTHCFLSQNPKTMVC